MIIDTHPTPNDGSNEGPHEEIHDISDRLRQIVPYSVNTPTNLTSTDSYRLMGIPGSAMDVDPTSHRHSTTH